VRSGRAGELTGEGGGVDADDCGEHAGPQRALGPAHDRSDGWSGPTIAEEVELLTTLPLAA
jgi:hypothetical protein